jgi:hypothetical protein
MKLLIISWKERIMNTLNFDLKFTNKQLNLLNSLEKLTKLPKSSYINDLVNGKNT